MKASCNESICDASQSEETFSQLRPNFTNNLATNSSTRKPTAPASRRHMSIVKGLLSTPRSANLGDFTGDNSASPSGRTPSLPLASPLPSQDLTPLPPPPPTQQNIECSEIPRRTRRRSLTDPP